MPNHGNEWQQRPGQDDRPVSEQPDEDDQQAEPETEIPTTHACHSTRWQYRGPAVIYFQDRRHIDVTQGQQNCGVEKNHSTPIATNIGSNLMRTRSKKLNQNKLEYTLLTIVLAGVAYGLQSLSQLPAF